MVRKLPRRIQKAPPRRGPQQARTGDPTTPRSQHLQQHEESHIAQEGRSRRAPTLPHVVRRQRILVPDLGQRRARREPAGRVPVPPQMDARQPILPHRRLAQRLPRPQRRLLRLVHGQLPLGQRPRLLHGRHAKHALPRRLEAAAATGPVRRRRQLRHRLRRRHLVPVRPGGALRRLNRTAHLEREDEDALPQRLRAR